MDTTTGAADSARDLDSWATSGPGLVSSMVAYRYAIVAATVLVAVVGYLVSGARTPVYEATATVFLSDAAWSEGGVATNPTRRIEQESNRLTSRIVLNRAAESLDGVDRGVLASTVTADALPAVGVVQVQAEASDAQTAADIANAVVAAYEQVSRDAIAERLESVNGVLETQGADITQEINRLEDRLARNGADATTSARLESLQAQLLALRTSISEMSADAALYGAGIEEVERALPPAAPSSPSPVRDAQIAALLAFAAASALAYWRAIVVARGELDRTALLGAPMLAEIPDFGRPTHGSFATDPLFDVEAAESYQFLVTSFEYALAHQGIRSVLVTSPRSGDGKSLSALHLARALAIQGRDVVLVDGDIRVRGLTKMLDAEGLPGLVAAAEGESVEAVTRRYRISQSVKLDVIPSGEPRGGPTGLLGMAKYRDAIRRITSSSELTIIDSGPLLAVADASSLAGQVGGVLLVLNARSGQDDMLKVRERLRLVATPLIGYVLNRTADTEGFGYSYGPPVADGRNVGRRGRDARSPGPAEDQGTAAGGDAARAGDAARSPGR